MSLQVKVERWSPRNESVTTETGYSYYDTNSVLKEIEIWKGKTKEEIFKRFDKANNRLKYCNGSHYIFNYVGLQREYREWYKSLDEATKFDMFYGGGVVD